MILLAFELSTRQSSIALQRDDKLLAERSWSDAQARSQSLFQLMPELLKEAGVALHDVDVFVAGRGPGNYTGIRVAITTAQVLKLPLGKESFAVSSGEALAWDIAEEKKVDRVAVLGDARRGQLWFGLFERQDGRMKTAVPWELITPAQLVASTSPGTVLVSSDVHRLSSLWPSAPREMISESCYPRAARVAGIAFQRLREGVASEPMDPLYMHPPV